MHITCVFLCKPPFGQARLLWSLIPRLNKQTKTSWDMMLSKLKNSSNAVFQSFENIKTIKTSFDNAKLNLF